MDKNARAAARESALADRRQEAAALEEPVRSLLASSGATDIVGFYTSNALGAKLTASTIQTIAQHPDVVRIEMSQAKPVEMTTGFWDGISELAAGGLDAGVYVNNGYQGLGSYAAGGSPMQLASFGPKLRSDHKGFTDGTGTTRMINFDCSAETSCSFVSGGFTSDFSKHQTGVMGRAAADFTRGQVSGTTGTDASAKSGIARQAELTYFYATTNVSAKTALELAIPSIDVFVTSWHPAEPDTIPCNGIAGDADIAETIQFAQLSGTLFISSGGNQGHSGVCNVHSLSESPSTFNVGYTYGNPPVTHSGDPVCDEGGDSHDYSACPISINSSEGGEDAHVEGMKRAGALGLETVVSPGYPEWCLGISSSTEIDSFNQTMDPDDRCGAGTSEAAPEVAGAATVFKDYMMANGHTSVDSHGMLWTMMMAMGDRQGNMVYRSNGFDRVWGAGRLQLRDMGNIGTAPWGWGDSEVVMGNGEIYEYVVGDLTNVGQFKAYAMVFEVDPSDMAWLGLHIKDKNCGTGSADLSFDSSFDVKKMARVGATPATTGFCVHLHAAYVPSGSTRRVHQFHYYSGDTSMR